MKKSRIVLSIALILIICLGAFYIYKINVFESSNLKSVDIRTGNFETPNVFETDTKTTTMLFNSITSLDETELIINDLDIRMKFQMILLNNWNLVRTYHVYFDESNEVFLTIDNSKTLYRVTDPTFFYSYDGFDALYDAQLPPEMTITLNQSELSFEQNEINWKYKKLNDDWYNYHIDAKSVSVESTEIPTVTSNDDILGVNLPKLPNEAQLRILDTTDNSLAFEGVVNVRQLPFPDYDGTFKYELKLDWENASQGFSGDTAVSFNVSIDLPDVFTVSKEIVKQGDLLVVTAYHVNDIDKIIVDQNLMEKFTWFKTGHIYRGYFPTNYNTKLMKYKVSFTNTESEEVTSVEIEVVGRDFVVQNLTVDPNVQTSTQSDAGYKEYREIFNPSRDVSAPERYYSEPFILPTLGRLNAEFGETRSINGVPTQYRHGGIDIGAARGSDVLATNTGKVVLAQLLILTGNTVIIDHGEGLFSIYEHLDSLSTTQGEIVERGQVIGQVGSTGFSTGPHLHFSMSYYRTELEPGYFLYGEPITKENYTTLMK
ncbi:MAG: hypothetical protein BGO41_14440 [Clostridiales bacterium 38-18]|nr:MAG: hypothetical protein BGO41_14440 [Clostridiales bacterium 38-18]